MRYIINIMGPMAVGKSTVIGELKDYLPHYEVLAIDDYRRHYSDGTPEGEMKAWGEMYLAAARIDRIIVESSGTSHNLKLLIESLTGAVIHVELNANVLIRTKRKEEREAAGYQKPPIYFDTIWFIERPTVYRDVLGIYTDKPPYEVAAEIIESLPGGFME